jgi:predicted transposase YdaD
MPFDATMKDLIESDPAAWSALGSDRPARRVTVEDADVSSVSAAADKVLRVEDDAGTWLHDIEPESSHAGEAPEKLFLYSTLLAHRHKLPVCSTLLLLRPEANAAAASGELRRYHPGEIEPYLIFRYRVVRVWEEPLERFMNGGLGTLPLAALTDEAKADLAGTVKRINERLRSLTNSAVAERLEVSTFILLGLRYSGERIAEVRKGVEMVDLRESSFYQLVRKEIGDEIRSEGEKNGRMAGIRQTILSQGRRKFGPPSPEVEVALEGIADQAKLASLSDRLVDVSSWEDLFAGA